MASPLHGTITKWICFACIHMERLFEWAVEILTESSADKPMPEWKRINHYHANGSTALEDKGSQIR